MYLAPTVLTENTIFSSPTGDGIAIQFLVIRATRRSSHLQRIAEYWSRPENRTCDLNPALQSRAQPTD